MIDKKEVGQSKVGVESGLYDNHTLDNFRNCPQFYEWRHEYCIIKSGPSKATAAELGSAIHLGLETYYNGGMTEESITDSITKAIEYFTPFQDPNDTKRSVLKLSDVLASYFQKYRREQFNVIATEVGGAFEIGPYLYVVRIDLVVEWFQPKGIYIVDHKTTSAIDRVVVKPNNQFTGYIAYARELYEDVLGLIWNGIGIYESEEVIDKNAPKVMGKHGREIYTKKKRETLIRIPTQRTSKEIADWKEEIIHTIKLIELCHEKGVWPRKTSFCTAYHSKCPYLDLCQSQDKKIVEPLMEAGVYEKVPWIPYRELLEEEVGG